MGSNPCRPYESYVHVGLRPELEEVEWSPTRVQGVGAKGGQFGLSLGLLLSKGGMMKPVARVFCTLLSSGHR